MKDIVNPEDNLKASFFKLKKQSDILKKDYARLNNEDFGKVEWNREGHKIKKNLSAFEKMLKDIPKIIEAAKNDVKSSKETVSTFVDNIEKIKEAIVPIANKIKEKVKKFIREFDQNSEEEEEIPEPEGEIIIDIIDTNKVLQQEKEKQMKEILKANELAKNTFIRRAQSLIEEIVSLNK